MMIRSETPQRLFLMQLSTATIPTAGGPLEMSTGCYLIQMSDGKNILIDSGLPGDFASPGMRRPTETKCMSSSISPISACTPMTSTC